MPLLLYVIIFATIGGVFSLLGGVWLLRNHKNTDLLIRYATPFAGGALLAAVFLDLLKEGLEIEVDSPDAVLRAALAGVILFFLAEGFLKWFHHHHQHDESPNHTDHRTSLIIVGDTIHNALDGMAIAAAFLISVPTGIVTTVAIMAHEIPQEIGDFGLLLSKGMRRRNVLLVNFLSALATVAAAILTYSLGSQDILPIGPLLGLSAGFLLYIAMSDIIPTIHNNRSTSRIFDIQAALLLLGVLVVGLITTVSHHYIETSLNSNTAVATTQHDY